MRYIILILSILTAGVITAADLDDYHLQVSLMQGDSISYEPVGASLTYDIGECQTVSGLFWNTKSSHGSRGGSSSRINDEDVTELQFDLSVRPWEDGTRIYGSIYMVQITAEGDITGGKRALVDQAIEPEVGVIVQLGDHREMGNVLQLTLLSGQQGLMSDEILKSPFHLITTYLVDGESSCRVGNGRSVLKPEMNVHTGFGTPPGLSPAQYLTYDIDLKFDDLGTEPSYPATVTLRLTRTYWIDTLVTAPSVYQGQSGTHDYEYDIVFRSEHVRQLELMPGKLIELVIPADSPSVRGFDIVDTVRILPSALE